MPSDDQRRSRLEGLNASIAAIPRRRFAHLPTPLEPLERLSEALGGPEIWIKRDDCTGLATGGNKARKLEFLVADAARQGCDTLVTLGRIQSNHARQTAAAAAVMGMRCVLILEELLANDTETYRTNGNTVLNSVLGADVRIVGPGGRTPAFIDEVLNELTESGATPYLVPVGGSDELGATGYVNAAFELDDQLIANDIHADALVMATASGGTQAGLVVGLGATGRATTVVGFSAAEGAAKQCTKVIDIADRCSASLGWPTIDPTAVIVHDNTLGAGYGQPDDRTIEAIRLFASTEGVVLDPVYTGKAAAGLVDGCRTGRFEAGTRLVFLHTGGQASMFGYEPIVR